MKIGAIAILIGILFQSFSRQVIFTEFLMNRNFIAKVLCEKKSDPVNQCRGKCHLKKQLDRDNERQERNQQNYKGATEVLFSMKSEKIDFLNYARAETTIHRNYTTSLMEGYSVNVFRPPSC